MVVYDYFGILQKSSNLNQLTILDDANGPVGQKDYGVCSNDGSVEVVFKNLAPALIRLIRKYPAVVGCVAWLTHFDILDELARRETVSLIVQKEDFLRPDVGVPSNWKYLLRRKYAALPDDDRYFHGFGEGGVGNLNCSSDPTLTAVRCVGNHNADRSPAFPRAHHKFLVFGDHVIREGDEGEVFVPRVVWTGSFNLTVNATNSFENAVILRDPDIVDAFYREWGQIVALSEPLDWMSDWAYPEFRIGT